MPCMPRTLAVRCAAFPSRTCCWAFLQSQETLLRRELSGAPLVAALAFAAVFAVAYARWLGRWIDDRQAAADAYRSRGGVVDRGRAHFEVRAGLHIGEVEVFGPSVSGVAVHIGARVLSLAELGEVL